MFCKLVVLAVALGCVAAVPKPGFLAGTGAGAVTAPVATPTVTDDAVVVDAPVSYSARNTGYRVPYSASLAAYSAGLGYAAAPVVQRSAISYGAGLGYAAAPVVQRSAISYGAALGYAASPVAYSAAPIVRSTYSAAPIAYSIGIGYNVASNGYQCDFAFCP